AKTSLFMVLRCFSLRSAMAHTSVSGSLQARGHRHGRYRSDARAIAALRSEGMHASVVPGFGDLAGLVSFVLRDPYLFISSSTVMTTGVVGLLGLFSLLSTRVPRVRRLLVRS